MQTRGLLSSSRTWLLAGVLTLASMVGLATVATAQEPPTPRTTPTATGTATPRAGTIEELAAKRGLTRLTDLGFADQRATGARANQEFFFPGPGDFTLGERSVLTVEFSHSNLLVPDRSTVTVVLNDRPLRAIYLDQANVNGLKYVMPIPKDLIRKDFNKLRLEYSMTLGLECEDPGNPALFSVLYATTQMLLDFAENPPVPVLEPPNLSSYPYPFFRNGYPIVAPVTILIPDNPNATEVGAAYRIATDITSRVAFDLAHLEIKQIKDVSAATLATHQMILVGTPQRMPLVGGVVSQSSMTLSGNNFRRAGTEIAPEHGVLVVGVSPWNRQLRALAITGSTDAAVTRDVDALTNPEPTALFAGPETILTQPITVEGGTNQFLTHFSFGQVGFADRAVATADAFNITFSAPQVAANSTGQIDLVVSTPETLDRRRSNIVVELNGQQIQTIELKDTQVRRASYRIRVPGDALRTGPNTLSFRTTVYTQDTTTYGRCGAPAQERVWAIIHADSAIALPQVVDQATVASGSTLASLPFPFAGLYGLQDTTFVVDPGRPASLRGGMLAAISLGRRAGARSRFDVQLAATATGQTLGDRHVVVIGIPSTAPLADEVGKVLPLVFGPGGSRALVAKDAKLTEILDSARLAALQTAPVPWTNGRRVLSFSGSDDEALNWVTEAVTKRGFDGNVALLQSPTDVHTFSLARLTDEELQRELKSRFSQQESLLMQLVAFGLVALGAIVVLLTWTFRDYLRIFRWRR